MSPIYEGVLDAAGVEALVSDIEGHAEIRDVFVKGRARAPTDAVNTPLHAAVEALWSGAAVQIRYRFSCEEWRDTLIPTPGGVRLVRARTPP